MNFIQGSVLKAHDVHEQSATEQTATASDGKNLSFLASAQEVEVCRNVVEEYTSGRLVGVVVLKVDKIPVEGTTTGEIQVTIGMSDKTRAASDAAHRKISESMEAREGGSQPDSAKKQVPVTSSSENNKSPRAESPVVTKPEVRTNDTLF